MSKKHISPDYYQDAQTIKSLTKMVHDSIVRAFSFEPLAVISHLKCSGFQPDNFLQMLNLFWGNVPRPPPFEIFLYVKVGKIWIKRGQFFFWQVL